MYGGQAAAANHHLVNNATPGGSRLPVFLFAPEEDGAEGGDAQGERVVEVRDNLYCADAAEGRGHQELCSVRDESLDHAGECVEYARHALARKREALGYRAGEVSCGDDRNGIVGGAEVRKAHYRGYGEFRAA